MRSVARLLLAALAGGLCGLGGCSLNRYARQADKAAYKAVTQKQQLTFGKQKAFSIDYRPMPAAAEMVRPASGERSASPTTQPRRMLSLDESLLVAFRNSRRLQDRKEALYASALNLANVRHDWSLLSGSVIADVSHTKVNEGEETNASTGELGVSFAQRFVHGGAASIGMAFRFASDLSGISTTSVGALMEAEFTQPLLRGAWHRFAYEELYRLERDLAIAVLDYERFTQSFSTDIATRYYRVLQQYDQLANERENIIRLEQTLRRTRVQVEGGHVSHIQQDQAEQDLLNARVRFTSNQQRYQNALDDFKLILALPVRADVVLDPRELKGLNQRGPAPIPFVDEQALAKIAKQARRRAEAEIDRLEPAPAAAEVEKQAWRRARKEIAAQKEASAFQEAQGQALAAAEVQAIDVALRARPDVLLQMADLRDARRDVEIAANQFLPGLDLALGVSATSTEPRKPARMEFHRFTRRAALELDYDMDQTDNRDAYRLSLIAAARAERGYEEFLDQVRFDVRQAYRQLLQARSSYDLEKRNVAVAQRRQRLAAIEQTAGRASARDVLEAQEDLRNALNGLTNALVTYETTRVQFLATLGMLDVDDNGKFHERDKPFLFKRLAKHYGRARSAAR